MQHQNIMTPAHGVEKAVTAVRVSVGESHGCCAREHCNAVTATSPPPPFATATTC